ncbi:MAG TPA: lysophospholipid acyltransferase family protein [Armatimonadota bacterium]|jgi:hypothetical protein
MRLRIRIKHADPRVLSTIAYTVVRGIGHSLHLVVKNETDLLARIQNGEGQVLVAWHGRTMVPLIFFRGKRVVTIISPSRDGEILCRLYRRFGWDAVRGSTMRGAAKVTLAALRQLRTGATLAITPDGPRGPAGIAQPGSLYMAKKTGCPIIPTGSSASRAWRLKSWDDFLIPKPFSRAAIVFGDPIYIPANPTPEELAELTVQLGAAINHVQAEADRLAGVQSIAPPLRDQALPYGKHELP